MGPCHVGTPSARDRPRSVGLPRTRRRDHVLGGRREAPVRGHGVVVDPLARWAELKVGGLVLDAVQRVALHGEANLRPTPDSPARLQAEAQAWRAVAVG